MDYKEDRIVTWGCYAAAGAGQPASTLSRRPVRTVPPYHTGKVQIGLTYVPRQRPHHDRDACRLQDALLGNKPTIDTSGIVIASVCAVVIAIPVFHHFMR